VEKTYLVKVSGRPTESAIEQLRRGIMIERGKPGGSAGRVLTEPATIRLMRDAENPWYEVVLTEGRNRQIRKLFEEIGHHVEKIRRVGYGTLVLDLPPGELRELDPREVTALERAGRPRKKAPEPPRALRKVEERHLPAARPARKRIAKRDGPKRVSR
jgi:23S rRNA pseudouridine2605 synthase